MFSRIGGKMKKQGKLTYKSIYRCVETISDKTVRLLILLIFVFFTVEMSRHAYRLNNDYDNDVVFRFNVSPLKQLLYAVPILLLLCIFIQLVHKVPDIRRHRAVKYLAIADSILVGVMLCIYVYYTHIPMHWDQLQVFLYAQDFMQGNYDGMQYVYLRIYPHQYGLIFLEGILLSIRNDYIFLQYVNAVLVMIIVYMTYAVSDEMFHNNEISLISLLGATLFLPLDIYVNYVYGDICLIAAALFVVWCFLKFRADGKLRYMIMAVVSATIGTLAKKNIIIPIIAITIVAVIYLIKKFDIKLLIFLLAILIIPIACNNALKAYYSHASGYEVDKGIPSTGWIAMGLDDDGYGGIGIYNGYHESSWNAVGGDLDKLNKVFNERLKERFEEFADDKKAAYKFFQYKISEQWCETTFSTINETGKGIDEKTGLTGFIYSDKITDFIYRYMNHYVYLLYLGISVFALISLFGKNDMAQLILPIAVIGGFIVSIFWEAKGKYILPYVVFMIPYMACGINMLSDKMNKLYNYAKSYIYKRSTAK
jgi:hypothetical protein